MLAGGTVRRPVFARGTVGQRQFAAPDQWDLVEGIGSRAPSLSRRFHVDVIQRTTCQLHLGRKTSLGSGYRSTPAPRRSPVRPLIHQFFFASARARGTAGRPILQPGRLVLVTVPDFRQRRWRAGSRRQSSRFRSTKRYPAPRDIKLRQRIAGMFHNGVVYMRGSSTQNNRLRMSPSS